MGARPIKGCNRSHSFSCCMIGRDWSLNRLVMNFDYIYAQTAVYSCVPLYMYNARFNIAILTDSAYFDVTVDSDDSDQELPLSSFFIPRILPSIARCALARGQIKTQCCVGMFVEVVERAPLQKCWRACELCYGNHQVRRCMTDSKFWGLQQSFDYWAMEKCSN